MTFSLLVTIFIVDHVNEINILRYVSEIIATFITFKDPSSPVSVMLQPLANEVV